MRTRTLNSSLPASTFSLIPTTYAGTCANPYAETVGANVGYSFLPHVDTKVMNDVLTPHWEVLRARGIIVNNPMDSLHTIETITKSSYFNRWYWKKWNTACTPDKWVYDGGKYEGENICNRSFALPVPELDIERLINLAVTEAWSSVELSKASAMMSLAEGNKTVASCVSIFKRLLSLLLDIKKFRIKQIVKRVSAKEVANFWMEMRYAVRPLFFEMMGVAKAVMVHDKAKPFRQTFRAMSSETSADEANTLIGDTRYYANYLERVERRVDIRSGVLTAITELSELNIWGLDQPLETVWEIIPFSFVVDWFFNVGQTIAAWTPEGGLTTLASWYVVTDTTTRSVTLGDHGIKSSYATSRPGYVLVAAEYQIAQPFTHTKIIVSKARVPNPTRAYFPQFSLRLNALKLTDLVLICRQIFYKYH